MVAKVLDTLLIRLTKPRARHSNDDDLVESKRARSYVSTSATPTPRRYANLFTPFG